MILTPCPYDPITGHDEMRLISALNVPNKPFKGRMDSARRMQDSPPGNYGAWQLVTRGYGN